MADMIHIKARDDRGDTQGVIRLTPKAYELLMEVVRESGLSRRDAASQIITQAIKKHLIVYDREDREEAEE